MPDAKTTVMERVRNVCHDNAVRAARYGERHRDAGNCPKDADLRALLALAEAAVAARPSLDLARHYVYLAEAEQFAGSLDTLVAAAARVTQAGG